MIRIVYSPFPCMDTARTAAAALLEQYAVACCNLLAGCESHYRWQGVLTCSSEVILIAKTTRRRVAQTRRIIAANHPYECPAILSFSTDSTAGYTAWVSGCVASAAPPYQSD